jgi:hypothetical protein
MLLNSRIYYSVIAAALLSACVSSGITPIGSNTLNPLPQSSTVYIYTSEKEVTIPFKVIGIISYTNPGKYRILSLADVIPDLKDRAREAGANGIIIDETHVIKSGIISTGIGVTGRAILIEQK